MSEISPLFFILHIIYEQKFIHAELVLLLLNMDGEEE